MFLSFLPLYDMICVTYISIIRNYLLLTSWFLSSSSLPWSPLVSCSLHPPFPSSTPLPLLSLCPSVACSDLVASGRDRKPNALVQVAVIDPHKQHLVSQACTEIVEVRQHTHAPSSVALYDLWGLLFCCVSVSLGLGLCSLHLCLASFFSPFPPSDSSNWNRQWALTFYFLWQLGPGVYELVCCSQSVCVYG